MATMLRKYVGLIWVLLLACAGVSCDSTRHLSSNEYLLKYPVQVKTEGSLKPEILQSSITLKPNRRILLPKSYLHLYNFGLLLRKDSSSFKNWMLSYKPLQRFYTQGTRWLVEDIGEKPILISPDALKTDSINLRNVAFANGYFNPSISYQIDTIQTYWERQKANVSFEVKENTPSKIVKVNYRLRDTLAQTTPESWHQFLAAYDTSQSLLSLKKGPIIYRHKLLEQERIRANNALRNSGYFTFSQSLIEFVVDTSYTSSRVSDSSSKALAVWVDVVQLPPIYTIEEIQINIRRAKDPPDVLESISQTIRGNTLTESLRRQMRLSRGRLADSVKASFKVTPELLQKVNLNFIARHIYLAEGERFSLSQARLTQQRLLELPMIQLASLNYEVDQESGGLTLIIDLQTAQIYQLKVGAESFTDFDFRTSTNLPVVGASLGLSNKNTFGQSELLELNVGGNFGLYGSQEDASNFQNIFLELGGNIKLSVPQFILPIGRQNNLKLERFHPQTTLSFSLSQENRQEFDRSVTGFDLGYRWHHIRPNTKKLIVSTLTPLAINFIDIRINSADFQAQIDSLPQAIRTDYQARFSSLLNYSFTYSTYGRNRVTHTNFIQATVEMGGNLPFLLDRLLSENGEGDNLFQNNLFYGQYLKGSLEYKRFIPLGPGRELILRGFMGAAKAYNTNQDSSQQIYLHVPYENRFFSGGANSMRGWRSNTLGPGRLSLGEFQNLQTSSSASSLLAPGGEIIFEANAEYRFDVYSYLELALFTDLGNVWFNQEVEEFEESPSDSPKSVFSRDNLVLGWDVGIGFRFDFSFLILRLDIGQQLFAPDAGWVIRQFPQDLGGSRSQFNLGISYPF
ncbi:MAG: BamA/TamA family outer membrane protein [Bacteroidota bacterium]